MPSKIGDYALIGDMQTAGLVGLDGSIDWLCLPRFDSGACFAALLGDPANGRWLLVAGVGWRVSRRPPPSPAGTRVLETEFDTADGTVRVVDFMPIRTREPDLVRRVEGVHGRVRMHGEIALRFDYGHVVPWIRAEGGELQIFAGPDSAILESTAEVRVDHEAFVADFEVGPGEIVDFRLTWVPPGRPRARGRCGGHARPDRAVVAGLGWAARCDYHGPYRCSVAFPHHARGVDVLAIWRDGRRTHHFTAGVARRDAQLGLPVLLDPGRHLTLLALLGVGYRAEAEQWRESAAARSRRAAGCRATPALTLYASATPRTVSFSSTATAS